MCDEFQITTTIRDSIEKHHLHIIWLEKSKLDNSYDYHDKIHDMLKENFGFCLENLDDEDKYGQRECVENFFKLLKDGDQELYPNCRKFTKLSCTIHGFNLRF